MNQDNDPIFELIKRRRIDMFFSHPFFANMLMRLKLVDASEWLRTAATDGKHFFFNREFIKGLTEKELVALMIHEILHVILDHVGRRGNRDKDLWNMAIDFIVNFMIRRENIGVLPECGLYDARFTDEMSADEVFDILMQESTVIKLPMDFHLDLAAENEEDDDENGDKQEIEIRVLGKNGPPKLSKEDVENLRGEIQAAVIQAAQCCENPGDVPMGIQRLIKRLTEAVMDWRSLLDAHLRSAVKDDFTFQQVSRRSFGDFIFPGHSFLDTIDIMVFIDASGSMTNDMIADIISEVHGIVQSFPSFKLRIASFDTKIYNYKEFTEANINELPSWEAEGCGGTSFEVCYEYMKENGIVPERMVMFTDGEPNNTWGTEGYCDTLFIIHGDPHKKNKAPFGLTVWYEDSPKTKKHA